MSDATAELLEIIDRPGAFSDRMRRELIEILHPPRRVSYEQFLVEADGKHAEWVKGEIIEMAPASAKNQDVSDFLISILRIFVEKTNQGMVKSAPFSMRLASNAREPDILFLATEHLNKLMPTYLDGPADLVIEIVSPDSDWRDRGEKFNEYEQAGIPEYWLIDPIREQATFYQLDELGHYQPFSPKEDGHYHSRMLPGLWISPAWFWQTPPVLEALRMLEII